MEIKEQIAELIYNNYIKPDRHFENTPLSLAGDIIRIFEQANPIQAGEDGLAKPNPDDDWMDCNRCNTPRDECGSCEQVAYLDGFGKGKVAQKALDDKEKAEAVKKVFDDLELLLGIEENTLGYVTIDKPVRYNEYLAFKKQTLKEQEKGE